MKIFTICLAKRINVKQWIKKKAWDPFLALLSQGVSPEKLAQCVAFGLVIAVFPALGLTTIMAAIVAIRFRLNMVAIQTVNYIAYPLQFMLLIPFFRAGERLFQEPPLSLSGPDIMTMINKSPLEAIARLWNVTWHAAVVWAILACVAIPLLTLLFIPIFKKIAPSEART
jgi:uncharacterized protein (DUF2062 family)